MINYNEISVVVQGPIYGSKKDDENLQITRKCCQSIRDVLPGAEIILSTWMGSDVEAIPCDIINFNEDPGTIMMTLNGESRPNNTNRMLVSSIEGIKKVTRKYCLKMRSDMILLNSGFTEYFDKYTSTTDTACVEKRVVTLSANHYKRGSAIIFTLNDWFAFGLTSDLLNMWDINMQNESDFVYANGVARFEDNVIAENFVWLNFLRKYKYYAPHLNFQGKAPINEAMIDLYLRSLADNVVICSASQLGVNCLKYWNKNYVRKDFMRVSCFTHNEWTRLYKKYCNPRYFVSFSFKDMIDKMLYKLVFSVQKRVPNMYKGFRSFYNKLKFH